MVIHVEMRVHTPVMTPQIDSHTPVKIALTASQFAETCALYASHAVENHVVIAVHFSLMVVLIDSHTSDTFDVTASHFSPNHSGIPDQIELIVSHASDAHAVILPHASPRKFVKDSHIARPVSVCVKNHASAATTATIAAIIRTIGFIASTAFQIAVATVAAFIAPATMPSTAAPAVRPITMDPSTGANGPSTSMNADTASHATMNPLVAMSVSDPLSEFRRP